MPASFTPHVAGDPMSWADLAANFAAARAWLNDIPAADIADGVIQREALVRPRILPFPNQAFESGFQRAFWMSYGLPSHDALFGREWGSRVERFLVKPDRLPTNADRWVTPISRTVYFPFAVDIDVQAHFEVCVRGPVDDPVYPDGAALANSEVSGRFRWHVYARDTDTETSFAAGEQEVYPTEGPGVGTTQSYTDQVHLSLVTSLAAGTYDLFVCYHLDDATVSQVDVSRVMVVGEAF